MRTLCHVVALMGVLLSGGVAVGATQTLTVTGSVLSADAGNLFGLTSGDPISLQATYDDTTLQFSVLPFIPFDSSTSNLLTITLGSIQLTEQNDVGHYEAAPAYPRLLLCEIAKQDVYRVDFISEIGTNAATAYYTTLPGNQFIAIDSNGGAITAEWNLSPCPEPSTWVLMSVAAMGFGLQRVRRRS